MRTAALLVNKHVRTSVKQWPSYVLYLDFIL